MSNFDELIGRVLDEEGGYVNDPNDPGGETKYGISKRSYHELDIANLTQADAIAIYKRDFWNPINGDWMPKAVAFQALDFAVNSGVETAIRYLQKALGVLDDGHWGPVTQQAASTCDEAITTVKLIGYRLQYMTTSTKWAFFGKGWANRIAADLLFAAGDFQQLETLE